jgi:ferredoxin/flavodoxin---NADP+ reductase
MTARIHDIVRQLQSDDIDVLFRMPEHIKCLTDLTSSEKTDIAKALASVFYRFQPPEPIAMFRLAIQAEEQLARFGPDVVPFLVSEIAAVDIESAAYLGKALARIGAPGLEYLLKHWNKYDNDENAYTNLIQALSYYKLPEVKDALPLVLNATLHENHSLRAVALYTLGRIVERSKGIAIDPQQRSTLFGSTFGLIADVHPLVRKNAVGVLGQMVRRNFLSSADERKVHTAFRAITGKDERNTWDSAFIVRQEAEHFLKYFDDGPAIVHAYTQSFRVIQKTHLCTNTCHFVIEAPFIARKIEAGQFIIVRPYERSERIPLSVCGWDRTRGTIRIIVSAVGKTSSEINSMQEGDTFKDVVGPLGQRSHIPGTAGTCVVIGGGYGTGAIIPTAADLKARGNNVIGIAGARTKESVIMIDELEKVCDEVIVTTNDGSCGMQGLVTDALREIVSGRKINHVLAVGPVPMMKAVSEITRPLAIETFVSLNAIMVDGTGMCGACRVSVGGETKFACFHGPDFDGHLVDFENLMKRQKMFVKEERIAFDSLSANLKTADCEHH